MKKYYITFAAGLVFIFSIWALLNTLLDMSVNAQGRETMTATAQAPVVSIKTETKQAGAKVEAEKTFTASEQIPLTEEEQKHLYDVCQEWEVPFSYALAIIETETNFDNTAVGSCGEVGYFQIHPINWERMEYLGLDPEDHLDNLECGVIILSENLDRFVELDAATMGYKCGASRAKTLIAQGYRLKVCKTVLELTDKWEEVIRESEVGYGI